MSPLVIPGTPAGIGHLCDHTCRIWEPTVTKGAARQDVVCHALMSDSVPCASNRKRSTLAQQQGGLGDSGQRMVYMDIGPAVARRQIIELVTGPNAPALLEVESFDTPRGHHIELVCSEWEGKLTPCS